tara:strand:+ start:3530 stop:3805 length:276 start_codon:yes stop_codon:yes gene_type:complete
METDIGNPIDYNPTISPLEGQGKEEEHKSQEEHYYYHPSEMTYAPPPPPDTSTGVDLFKNVDKSTWIIAFAVFLLGFFMGKTMQPVILRYS